jgi:hypothetical protein
MERIKEAEFKSLTEANDPTTVSGTMMMQVIGVFAQFERSVLAERIKAGLDAARRRGCIGGRRPSSGRINRMKSLRLFQRATHRAQIRAFLGFREMPPNYVTRRGRDAPPHSPAGWRRGAGDSPKHLVVDRRDGVSKALHCKSAYGKTIFFYRFNPRSVSNLHSPSVVPGKRRNCLAARA